MNTTIQIMLNKYKIESQEDEINSLREICQSIALLGLWRGKFFEQAAFYGGTALRILYGLDRFSEDMNFSLSKQNKNFSLEQYCPFIEKELNSFGFSATVNIKKKTTNTQIESAFLKADTLQQLLVIKSKNITGNTLADLKIKFEVDTNPPANFNTEIKSVLLPIPFNVKVFMQDCLFAGKLHAILCRNWKSKRIKGRDLYDFVWYVARDVSVNLKHLQKRLEQTVHWNSNNILTREKVIKMLKEKFDNIDFEQAKKDVLRFIDNKDSVLIWSKEFFFDITEKLKFD